MANLLIHTTHKLVEKFVRRKINLKKKVHAMLHDTDVDGKNKACYYEKYEHLIVEHTCLIRSFNMTAQKRTSTLAE